jgi:lambda family phage portal protein
VIQRLKRGIRKWLGVPEQRGIDAANSGRLLADWITMNQTADDEIRWTLSKMRARARDLEKNNGIARHFLRAAAANVIGPYGFKHSPRVRNNDGQLSQQINRKISEAWDTWTTTPALDGRFHFNGLSRLLLKTVARDGEVIVRKWRGEGKYGLALESIEADQLDEDLISDANKSGTKPNIHMGVEMDAFRRPIAYYLWDRPADSFGLTTNRKRLRVPADEIFHLYDPDRLGQTRGPSWLVASIIPLRHLNGYIESELVAARISAAKMLFFQQKQGELGQATPAAGQTGFITEASPGQMAVVPPGYEIADYSPEHPSTAFGAFVKGGMRQVATALGMSYNALANDLEGVNYSSMRSGLLVERDYWRMIQEWWEQRFLLPLYAEWMRMAVLSGELVLDTRDARKYLSVKFAGRGWPWVDPLKDMQAGVLGIQSGLASRTQLLAETGQDFEEVISELAEEQRMADLAGVEISGPDTAGAQADDSEDEPASGEAAKEKQNGAGRNGHSRRRFIVSKEVQP